jgi:hypothetical protein
MRVPEEPVCIHLLREIQFLPPLPAFEIYRSCRTASEQNPVLTTRIRLLGYGSRARSHGGSPSSQGGSPLEPCMLILLPRIIVHLGNPWGHGGSPCRHECTLWSRAGSPLTLTEFLSGNPPFTFKGIYSTVQCSCRIKERLDERNGITMHRREAKGETTGICTLWERPTDGSRVISIEGREK